jgi:hypothetical protein
MMSYDYRKLIGKISEIFGKQYAFAKAIGWSERTCCLKLNSKIDWKQTEIIKACALLHIDEADISTYFFNLKVL